MSPRVIVDGEEYVPKGTTAPEPLAFQDVINRLTEIIDNKRCGGVTCCDSACGYSIHGRCGRVAIRKILHTVAGYNK